MKSSSSLILAAAVVTLLLSGCKKPEQPGPATPEPKAEASGTTESDAGKTTTFEPPAPEPTQQPPSR